MRAVLPFGLRWHLWYRRQLRRLHLMRPLAPRSSAEELEAFGKFYVENYAALQAGALTPPEGPSDPEATDG